MQNKTKYYSEERPGGGKSFGQLLDAFLYALQYPGIKQLILRRTYPELEKSLIRTSLGFYPKEVCKYNDSKKMYTFENKSIIDFGYCDSEKDVFKYQSQEYDVIRFDEATHFTEYMYSYIKTRCRGVNNFPKQVKSTTNPGGIGHTFFKDRFIDFGTDEFTDENGTRLFIPARLKDNKFLMESDPNYAKRLNSLPEKERKALLDGDWNIFEGMYFSEFRTDIHILEPFVIPEEWNKYATIDYGLDMFAVLWIAVDPQGNEFVYKELYQNNLIVSDAARKFMEYNGKDKLTAIFAPPDLWNRRNDTGRSAADIFKDVGVVLKRTNNDRILGWYAVKEHLRIFDSKNEQTGEPIQVSKLRIFRNCRNLIRTLPQLQYDDKNPNDVSSEPHELTHINDALRGFCIERSRKTEVRNEKEEKRRFFRMKKHEDTIKALTYEVPDDSFFNY